MAHRSAHFHDIDDFLWVHVQFKRWPSRAIVVFAAKNDGDYSPRSFKLRIRDKPEIAALLAEKSDTNKNLLRSWLIAYLPSLDWNAVLKVKASGRSGSPPTAFIE